MDKKDIKASLDRVRERLKSPDASLAMKEGFENIRQEISKIKIQAPVVNIPKFPAPEVVVNIPETKTPEVVVNFDASKIRIPEVRIPSEMDVRGWVSLMGFDKGLLENPLPVQMRDAKGRPIDWAGLFPSISVGGGSGQASSSSGGLTDTELRASAVPVIQMSGAIDSVYITDIAASSWASIQNGDGRLKVSVETGGSGLTDSELRATPVPVQQVSGYADSVYILGAAASTYAEILNPDGRVKVELPTGSSGLTDAELRAAHLDVQQLSGSIDSVSVVLVTDIFSTTITSSVVNPDNRVRVELPAGASGLTDAELRASHLDVEQVSGSSWSVNVVSPANQGDVATALRVVVAGNSDASVYVRNPVDNGDAATALRVVIAGNSAASVTATLAASSTVNVNGSLNSVIAVGATLHDAVDVGSAPQKVGGVAVTTANPTAVAGGDIVNFRADDVGRQLTRPIQARDLIRTAYVSVTNGTETTLIAAVAGSFLDCVSLMGSNNSDVAVSVAIRCTTAGNIVHTIRIPADSTAGWVPQVPWPQDATGNNWTIDGPDETGRTLTFSALFSQEI